MNTLNIISKNVFVWFLTSVKLLVEPKYISTLNNYSFV